MEQHEDEGEHEGLPSRQRVDVTGESVWCGDWPDEAFCVCGIDGSSDTKIHDELATRAVVRRCCCGGGTEGLFQRMTTLRGRFVMAVSSLQCPKPSTSFLTRRGARDLVSSSLWPDMTFVLLAFGRDGAQGWSCECGAVCAACFHSLSLLLCCETCVVRAACYLRCGGRPMARDSPFRAIFSSLSWWAWDGAFFSPCKST